jgi:MoaA/NifB/PqqE/SkfB family radical SAM enzyme
MSELIAHRASPQKVIWRITDRCDLDCAHCGSHGPLEAPEVLSLDELLAIAEDIAETGCETVVISGGEPLVHEGWQAVAEALLQSGVGVTLVTNGSRFSADVASWCRDAGIAAVHFSVDGTEAAHGRQRREEGSFAAVMGAIRRAREHTLRVAVVTTITRMVLDDLEALHGLLQQAGAGHWQLRLAARHARSSLAEADYLDPKEVPALVERLRAVAEDPQPPRLFAAPSIGYYGEVETDLRGAYSTDAWSGCTCGLTWCTIEPGGEVKACGSSTTIEGNVRETRSARSGAGRGPSNRRGAFRSRA